MVQQTYITIIGHYQIYMIPPANVNCFKKFIFKER